MNKNSYFCLMNIDYLAPPRFQWWPVSPLLQHRNLEQTSSSSNHLGLWGFSPKGTIKNVKKTKQNFRSFPYFYNELNISQRHRGSALKILYNFFAQKWLQYLNSLWTWNQPCGQQVHEEESEKKQNPQKKSRGKRS